MTRSRRWGLVLLGALLLGGCVTLQQLAALRQVAFSLNGVSNGSLAGVPLSRVSSFDDLTLGDARNIAVAYIRGEFPLEFDLTVRAENPADNLTTATMVSLDWTLFLDDTETVSGLLDGSFALPPGQPVDIPLPIALELREFFDGPAESLVNIAAGLVGAGRDPTRIELRGTPSIDSPLGPIPYPSPITIVSRTVTLTPAVAAACRRGGSRGSDGPTARYRGSAARRPSPEAASDTHPRTGSPSPGCSVPSR